MNTIKNQVIGGFFSSLDLVSLKIRCKEDTKSREPDIFKESGLHWIEILDKKWTVKTIHSKHSWWWWGKREKDEWEHFTSEKLNEIHKLQKGSYFSLS
jgi:hypothetical protein